MVVVQLAIVRSNDDTVFNAMTERHCGTDIIDPVCNKWG